MESETFFETQCRYTLYVDYEECRNPEICQCVGLKGKSHGRCERKQKAAAAASTENTRVVWYVLLLKQHR